MPFQKHFLLFLGLIFSTFFSVAEQRSAVKLTSNSDSTYISKSTSYLSGKQVITPDSIVNYGRHFLNKPYRYGSTGADSFDCSGYTSYVYNNFGYNLAHSSSGQANQFDTVKRSHLKTGDLVFFAGTRKSKRIGHVGIVVAANESGKFNFIHASSDKGVTISSSEEPYYNSRFIKANRVIGGTQLLAVNPSVADEPENIDQSDMNVPLATPAKKIKKTIPAVYHKVKSGETLSGIASKYGISVTELKSKNGITGSKLSLKQKLKIKDSETYTVAEPVKTSPPKANEASVKSDDKTPATEPVANATHIVKKGETLYSISKQTNIPVDELKQINKLQDGQLHTGQELKLAHKAEIQPNVTTAKYEASTKSASHKVASGESLFSIAKTYNISVDELKKMNDINDNNIHVGQVLKITQPTESPVTSSVAPKTIVAISKVETKPVTKPVVAPVKSEPTPKAEVKTEPKSEPRIESKPESKPEPISKPNAATKIIVHKVHEGENLQTIARDFKVSLDELKRINNLEAIKLSVGQEIFICLNPQAVVINPVVSSVKSPATVDAGPTQIFSPKQTVVKEEAANSQSVVKPETPTKSEAVIKPIYHKVKKGETLNEISRQYNVSVEDLKSANNLKGNKISVGKKLKINQTTEFADKKEISQKVEQPSKAISHKVRRKETLKSIAADFNLTVGELKELNNLKSNKVHSGQELIVSQSSSETAKKKTSKAETSKPETKHKTLHHKVKSGESYYSIAEKFDCTVKELKEWNNKTDNKLKPGVVLTIKSSKK